MRPRADSIDPRAVILQIAFALQQLAEHDDEVEHLDSVVPMTETLPVVLLDPTRDVQLDLFDRTELNRHSVQNALYVGFEFALRCVTAVLESPLADNRSSIQDAASSCAMILVDGLPSRSRSKIFRDLPLESAPFETPLE